MTSPQVYFLNENYDKLTDLLVPEHDLAQLFISQTELSTARPLPYRSLEVPSMYRKKLYDGDGLFVDEEIYQILTNSGARGLYIVPVQIRFSDDITFNYYRIDTRQEFDLIDLAQSTVDEDGDLEEVVLDTTPLTQQAEGDFTLFRLNGLDAIQYMVSEGLRDKLVSFHDDIVLSTEQDYELLW